MDFNPLAGKQGVEVKDTSEENRLGQNAKRWWESQMIMITDTFRFFKKNQ